MRRLLMRFYRWQERKFQEYGFESPILKGRNQRNQNFGCDEVPRRKSVWKIKSSRILKCAPKSRYIDLVDFGPVLSLVSRVLMGTSN